MKPSKMKDKPVYICRKCYEKDNDINVVEYHPKIKAIHYCKFECNVLDKAYFIRFDSQQEYAFYLKHIHGKPGITDVEIHPVIKMKPGLRVRRLFYIYGESEFIEWPFTWNYTADFRYKKDGKEMIVDVIKGFNKKTGKPRIIDTEKYRINCWLVETIYGTPVYTYSGGLFFRWNEKFTRLEVKDEIAKVRK